VARDGTKNQIGCNHLEQIVGELTEFDDRITEKGNQFLNDHLFTLRNLEKKNGIIEVPWCGDEKCGLSMEEEVDMISLGIPYPEKAADGNCAVCGKAALHWIRLAKSY